MSSLKSDTVIAMNKIILTNSATWEDWNERCLGQANMYRLLDHIQGREDSVTKPGKPSMADYPQKHAAEAHHDETQTTSGTSINVTNVDFSDHRQKHYKMAWNFYQDDLKPLEKQQDPITKMKA
jgi:hypothetical protein